MNPMDFDATSDNQSAQVIQIESNKLLPMMIVMAMLCGVSIAVSIIGFSMLRDRVMDSETETRMFEYYVQQSDAELVKAGIKHPEDTFKFKQEHK